jgi:hypothetical protein
MKFAQFQSTYKPLPIQTYEQTGQALENSYYKNREQSSMLRQAMSNTKVEDRNLNILAKATTDTEQILNSVNGQWQYATNALFNAKDRIVNDKALNASVEDYAKKTSEQTELQKRFEEGKTTQEVLDAYNVYNKFYNTKSIEVDPTGTIKNRWANISAPNKPDIDTQATKMIDILLKNPDSIDSGLRTILDKNGVNTGYLERVRSEGVGADKIFGLVKGYLANSPEVKGYYQYINNADLLAKTGVIDNKGDVHTKSILPQLVDEYRNLGWNVDNNGNLLDNYQHYINGKGEFDIVKDKKGKSVQIKDAPSSLMESANVKLLMNEDKLSLEDALKQTYLSHKLNSQLNGIAEDYEKFAFQKVAAVDTIKDEGYWLNRKAQKEKETAAGLAYMSSDKAGLYTTDYSMRDAQNYADQLHAQPQTPDIIQKYKEQTQNIQVLSKTFADTPNGQILVDKLWNDATKELPLDKVDIANKTYKQAFKDYLTGTGTIPDDVALLFNRGGIPVGTDPNKVPTPSVGGFPVMTYVPQFSHLQDSKIQFQKEIDKQLKNGLTIENNYRVFRGEDGKQSPFHAQQGDYIKQHGDSWILPGNLNKQGEPIKLQDYIPKLIKDNKLKGAGYNPDQWNVEYFPSDNTSTGFGTGVIKFTPNKNFPNGVTAPIIPPVTIRPDASVKNADLFTNSKYLYDNSTAPEIKNYAEEGMAMSLYGDTFAPLLNNLAVGVELGGGQNLKDERTILNVPFGNKSYTMELKPTANSTGDGVNYSLFITPESALRNGVTTPTNLPVAIGNSIPDMIRSLYIQHNKALSNSK